MLFKKRIFSFLILLNVIVLFCNIFSFVSFIKLKNEEIFLVEVLKEEIIALEQEKQEYKISNNKIIYNYSLEDIQNLNLAKYEDIKEEELIILFKNTKIENYIPEILYSSKKNNLNILFLSSLMILESDWGNSPNSYGNLFGWIGEEYSSIEDSIIHISSKIKQMYLTDNGKYFKGYTLKDVNYYYNGSKEWYDRISLIMFNLYQELDEIRKV